MPKCCARRRASITNLTQVLRLCLPGVFDPKAAPRGSSACSRAPLMCRISRRLMPTVTETEAKVRKSFERILGAAP